MGIVTEDGYMIASAERAIADTVLRTPDYYFDRLDHLDFARLREIAARYATISKKTSDRLYSIIQQYASQ